jgi:hypothetical protein
VKSGSLFAFPAEIRKIIYTTNSIEAVNRQLRKIIKTRGHFPTEDAALKLLWLALMRAEKKWTYPILDWPRALHQFAIYFPAVSRSQVDDDETMRTVATGATAYTEDLIPVAAPDDHRHRSRMPTRNDGSGPCDANSATGPSSGATNTSSGSCATTSSTTTRTGPTGASGNAHPTIARSSSTGPASRSDDTPPAADSSTGSDPISN